MPGPYEAPECRGEARLARRGSAKRWKKAGSNSVSMFGGSSE
jgi:hypothetical protein